MFREIRIDDPELRQWFVDVIRARASSGQRENHAHKKELHRQAEQIEAKLVTLLEMRIEGEITQDETR